jgi:hypothetical protein
MCHTFFSGRVRIRRRERASHRVEALHGELGVAPARSGSTGRRALRTSGHLGQRTPAASARGGGWSSTIRARVHHHPVRGIEDDAEIVADQKSR